MSTKIKSVEEKVKDNGKKSYKFFLEDGTAGYITNDKPWTWKQGEEVTYTKEEKKTPNGSYNSLTLTRVEHTNAPVAPQAPAPKATPLVENKPTKNVDAIISMKYEARLECIKLANNFFLEGKLTNEQAKDHCREWVVIADELIDDLTK